MLPDFWLLWNTSGRCDTMQYGRVDAQLVRPLVEQSVDDQILKRWWYPLGVLRGVHQPLSISIESRPPLWRGELTIDSNARDLTCTRDPPDLVPSANMIRRSLRKARSSTCNIPCSSGTTLKMEAVPSIHWDPLRVLTNPRCSWCNSKAIVVPRR